MVRQSAFVELFGRGGWLMLRRLGAVVTLAVMTLALGACAPAHTPTWAIAIHGGAGTLSRSAPPEQLRAYRASLQAALDHGAARLAKGESAVDVCESVVRMLEDDPKFNAGKGAAFNEKGAHELDASIMHGATLRCGAVAGVRTVKNPVSLARLVMERTPHVLLMGDGAEEFAGVMGAERVPNSYFDTPERRRMLEERLEELRRSSPRSELPRTERLRGDLRYSTVGCVALDVRGELAAATSTGGLTAKKFGRVGDSPVIGAGTYADDTAAISCTGTGEEFIRHGVARAVALRMKLKGETLEQATNALIHATLKPDDGGLIAVDARGNIAMPYSTEGMYRGWATSLIPSTVRIFKDE
jgi:beta-aspartyl-peptidase (threonine type)